MSSGLSVKPVYRTKCLSKALIVDGTSRNGEKLYMDNDSINGR